jgi:hypothetical protein
VLPEQRLTLKSISVWLLTEHSPSLDTPKRWPVAPDANVQRNSGSHVFVVDIDQNNIK